MVEISQGGLMVIFCALVVGLSRERMVCQGVCKKRERRTYRRRHLLGFRLRRLHRRRHRRPWRACGRLATRGTIDFASVMPDKEDEVFGCEVSGAKRGTHHLGNLLRIFVVELDGLDG